jgi:predicted nucleic-acid-binding Zn-ribbon protein
VQPDDLVQRLRSFMRQLWAILLPGLKSSLFDIPRFQVIICADCGITRFYTEERARSKLNSAKQRKRLGT